jgi:hypothetical protein
MFLLGNFVKQVTVWIGFEVETNSDATSSHNSLDSHIWDSNDQVRSRWLLKEQHGRRGHDHTTE